MLGRMPERFPGRNVQELTVPVLIALAVDIVLIGGYHLLLVGPRLRRLAGTSAAHDELLGGGAAPGTRRLEGLETANTGIQGELLSILGRLDALERIARTETPRIGFVRYNAFDDVGSDQSYALALLTKEGDGVVLSSIYSREETRTYGKAVEKFQPAADASREERAAILKARAVTT
jgi:hypothetical protein